MIRNISQGNSAALRRQKLPQSRNAVLIMASFTLPETALWQAADSARRKAKFDLICYN